MKMARGIVKGPGHPQGGPGYMRAAAGVHPQRARVWEGLSPSGLGFQLRAGLGGAEEGGFPDAWCPVVNPS
jgi:hypothetical protein